MKTEDLEEYIVNNKLLTMFKTRETLHSSLRLFWVSLCATDNCLQEGLHVGGVQISLLISRVTGLPVTSANHSQVDK